VDEKIKNATEGLQNEIQALHNRFMRGQLSQEAYEQKVADIGRKRTSRRNGNRWSLSKAVHREMGE
jgi:hypothetical protein